jgi:Tol biopolymer transport system component
MGGVKPEDTGLFVMRPDGTGARRVSARVGPTVGWSPDGRFVLTGSQVIGLATGAAVDLGKEVADAIFAPDGRSVIYRTFDQGRSTISAVDVDGTNRRKVAEGSFFTVYR